MTEPVSVVVSNPFVTSVVVDEEFDVANIGNSSVIAHTHPLADISDMSVQSRAFNAASDTAAQLAAIDLHSSLAVSKEMATVAVLVADTTLTYTPGTGNSVAVGDYIRTKSENFVYQVADSAASDNHIATAGGVKLYVMLTPSGLNVMAFGAKADGVTDDSAAIQKAIDAFKPVTVSVPTSSKIIYLPKGTYLLNSPIAVYSGTHLRGDGVGSILLAGPSVPSSLIALTGNGAANSSNQYKNASIDNLYFSAGSGTWAIKAVAGLILTSTFTNLVFNCNFGIDVATGTYTQTCRFQNLFSLGSLDQLIRLQGNFNIIEDVDKESGTGSTTDPYILLYGAVGGTTLCNDNHLRRILIEGAGSVNKPAIKFLDAWGNYLHDFWNETNASNGYALDLDNSLIFQTGNTPYRVTSLNKAKLRNGSTLQIERIDTNSQDVIWTDFFDTDSTSTVDVNKVYDRRSNDILPLDIPRVRARQFLNSTQASSPVAGFSPDTLNIGFVGGQNMLVNGSFEAGVYGWDLGGMTATIVSSEVAFGNMLQLDTSVGSILQQSLTIPAGLVGRPITITRYVKVVGTGYAIPFIGGTNSLGTNRVTAGKGWQRLKITLYPVTTGSLGFGVRMLGQSGATTIYIDELTLSPGEDAVVNSAKFGSYELNNRTFTVGSAVPTTGTWKVGDRVFNSAPAVGSPKSWVCTVAGTPGTWVSEGNL